MQGIIKSQSTTARAGEVYEHKVRIIIRQDPCYGSDPAVSTLRFSFCTHKASRYISS